MKKTHLICSIIVSIFVFTGTAFAETSSNVSRISEIKQKITDLKQKNLEDKAKIKMEIASTTANIKIVKQELKSAVESRIGKKLDEKKNKVADGFEKSIQNLKDLVLRIESRISKMELNNTDVSSPKLILEIVNSDLALAETELVNLENLLTQDIPTATSTKKIDRKNLLQKIKDQSEKTKLAIKTAHNVIVDVINSLKPGQLKEKSSTSTLETTPTIN